LFGRKKGTIKMVNENIGERKQNFQNFFSLKINRKKKDEYEKSGN